MQRYNVQTSSFYSLELNNSLIYLIRLHSISNTGNSGGMDRLHLKTITITTQNFVIFLKRFRDSGSSGKIFLFLKMKKFAIGIAIFYFYIISLVSVAQGLWKSYNKLFQPD